MRRAGQGGSIRSRVTVAAVLLLGLLSASLLAAAWRSATRAADEAFDRVIGASALSIVDSLRISEGRVAVEIPQAALAMIGLRSDARVFYRVVDPVGSTIAGQVTLGLDLPGASEAGPVFSTGSFRGTLVRFAVVGRYFDSGWATAIVAETLESRAVAARQLFFPSLAAVLIVFAIAIALIFFGILRAFRPLALIERELRHRGPTDLTPIAAAAPQEVDGLVAALDDFMRRLADTLDRIQNYASHAAHEVRTPIAVIRAQAAAALSEPDLGEVRQRLRRIEVNAEAAGQIVNQLLIDASVQHRLGTQMSTAVNLADLCQEVINRLDPLVQPAVRLIVEAGDHEACQVRGDIVAVREAIRNLVDNALKYAPTGLVLLKVERAGEGWQVEVRDSGPGIPETDMARMTERFSRGPHSGEVAGAGLGLHIVRKVAEAYGGRLDLANRPGGGLSAVLSFRRAVLVWLAVMLAAAQGDVALAHGAPPTSELRLLASIDRGLLEPLVAGFERARPDIRIVLDRVDPQLALARIQSQAMQGASPDLVIGHAADVLVELVNDGYGGAGLRPLTPLTPGLAQWRGELFSFAFDEGVYVYRKSAFAAEDMPRNRTELIRLLDRQGERLRNRVGTLDVGNNGTAFLMASQEARLSASYWRLIRAFGSIEARIYWSTGEMAEALLKGEIDLAYNAVASELGALRADARFAVFRADDVRLVFPHAAFMPSAARSKEAALAFMRFVLSPQGQAIVESAGASPVNGSSGWDSGHRGPPIQHVSLGPGLLALRDLQTRSALMETWLQLILTR
jgi:two-component system, OmpR family, sensor histidine kinase TctE